MGAASFILGMLVVFATLSFYSSFKAQDPLYIETESYLKEFYEGTKDSKISRFFITVFLLRRFLSVIWVVTTVRLPLMARVIGFAVMQLVFLIYTFVRPMQLMKENAVELINDITYFTLS